MDHFISCSFGFLTDWLAVLSRDLLTKSLPPGISDSVISNKGITLLVLGNVLPLSDISESGIPGGRDLLGDKGQIISECPYEKVVCPKIATKKFLRFLSWKFSTSRLLQNRVYLLANRT